MSTPVAHARRPVSRATSVLSRAFVVTTALLVGAAFAGPAAAADTAGGQESGSLAALVSIGAVLCLVGFIGAAAILGSRHRARLHAGMTRVTAASAVSGTAVKRATSSGAGTTARHLGTSFEWTRAKGSKVADTTKRASSAALQATTHQVDELKSRTGSEPAGGAQENGSHQIPSTEDVAPEPERPAKTPKAVAPATKAKPKPKPARPAVEEGSGEPDAPAEPPAAGVEKQGEPVEAETPEAAEAQESSGPAETAGSSTPAPAAKPARAARSSRSASAKPAASSKPGKPGATRPARRRTRRSRRR
jgi:hypothetical protein